MQIDWEKRILLLNVQGSAPKIAKFVYNSNNKELWQIYQI